jgi:hypothetical protein
MFYVLLATNILDPILYVLDVDYYYTLLRRHRERKKGVNSKLTQLEANE